MKKPISFKGFIKILKKYDLIVLGELHGTKEIPELMKKIIESLLDEVSLIFLEIPMHQQRYLDTYLISEQESSLYEIPFFEHPSKDGRGSKEYLLLIQFLKKMEKKKIFCIDPEKPFHRDYTMYQNIIKNMGNSKGIFISGNVHACKQPLEMQGKLFKPCAYYLKRILKQRMVSVNIVV